MTDDNIINFPRIGFSRPSAGGGQGSPPPPTQPPPPARSGRRSPLQIAAAVANPPAVRQGGGPPTTFRAGAPDDAGARLGALSLATVLAVAVAALRGTVTVLEDRRQRRMQRDLEMAPLRAARIKNQLAREQARNAAWEAAAKNAADQKQARDKHGQAMRDIGNKNAEQRAKGEGRKKVPSSQEFGRKATGGGKGPSGGAGTGNKGTGSGTGRGNKAGSGGDKSAGGGAKKQLKKPELGGGRGGKGAGGDMKPAPLKKPVDPRKSKDGKGLDKRARQKSPMRGSQGAGADLKKKTGQGAGDTGKGRDSKKQPEKPKTDRTKLPQALKDTAQKAADRRLGNRRKNPDKPAAWKRDNAKAGSDSKKKPDPNKDPKAAPKTGTDKPSKVDLNKGKASDKNGKTGTGTPDRTKLWDAFKNDTKAAANDRWARRGGDRGVPPLWKNDKRRQKKQTEKDKPRHEKPKSGASAPGPKSRWSRARDRFRNAGRDRRGWSKDDCFGGTASDTTTGQGSNRTGTTSSGRRSPFDNVPQSGAYETKVEREDRVGAQARTWKPGDGGGEQQALPADGQGALPAAPEPHTQRPGTGGPFPMPPAPTSPRTSKEPRMPSGPVGAYGGRRMDPQHATEITHDDAVDAGIKLKGDGLKTHQQSHVTAHRARKLRDTLRAFAEHLATQNNIIGPLFSGTMASLGESMDLLARMADEMQSRSLRAAENAEGASNEMEDAYRPITQATADAGLTTPSAPAHNET